MRKIVAGLFISLDGVVDSPESSPHRWTSQDVTEWIADGMAQADAVLLGPRTYRLLAQFWQHRGGDVPIASFLNNSPKYVVSHAPDTMGTLAWQPATLIRGDLASELAKLKARPGKNIQVPGSPGLVRSLLRDGMLDELNLAICPIVVGPGTRLFDGMTAPLGLRLLNAQAFGNGVLAARYQPVRSEVPAGAIR
jgi:dihydrofolate reductase